MIYDKNNKYFRIFIITHKNTMYIMYLVRLLHVVAVAIKRFDPPCHVAHEEFSRTCAWLLNYFLVFFWILTGHVLWEVLSFQVQIMFSIFRLGLFYNY
jgi:hypothetical protein